MGDRRGTSARPQKPGRQGAGYVRDLFELAQTHLQAGRLKEAEEALQRVVSLDPRHAAAAYHLGKVMRSRGRRADAVMAFQRSLELDSKNLDAHLMLGIALREHNRHAEAEMALRDALELRPNHPPFLLELANALAGQGQQAAAMQTLRAAIVADPAYALAHYNLGNLLREAGQLDEAAAAYETAIRSKPDYAEAFYNLGVTLQKRKDSDRAIAAYRRAGELRPTHAGTFFNLGNELRNCNRLDEATGAYHRAVAVKPDYAEAHYNLGNVLRQLRRFDEAATAYRACLRAKPDYALATISLGRILRAQQKFAEAEQLYTAALRREPNDTSLLERLADVLRDQTKSGAARLVYERILALQPDHAEALAGLVHLKASLCDWRSREADFEHLMRTTQRQIAAGERTGLSSFATLSRPLTPEIQLSIAQTWAEETKRLTAEDRRVVNFAFERRSRDRIRVAYVSSDFYNHATSHLIQGLFGRHDRGGFEIYAVSHGKNDGSSYRKRIEADSDRFIDVAAISDREAAQSIYDAGVDILVDLNGYTQNHQLGISALRPAPVIMTYLGFPGSSGADFIDYAIVDKIVVMRSEERFYSEKLVYLPNCYQVNDREQPIDQSPIRRADCRLPEEGFVYCCFNNNYKLEPFIFDIWMRILKKVPGSVLWLLQLTPEFETNIRREAAEREVDPDRIVFADKIGKARHLGRHRLADLFLDTRYYTAHTTCTDALWAGLPVLTCPGETFASRVSSSILSAAGLPELVASDFGAYEARAVELAGRPAELQALREKLAANRLTCPLFDTARFARNVERGFRLVWQNYLAGKPPSHFVVNED
jgi:protein O-GlcNAc transferase